MKRDTSNHTCHAIDCRTHCKPEHLMCPRHWRMVPRRLQSAVYVTYRPGQCDDMSPSQSWCKAAWAAIEHVAVQERIPASRIAHESSNWQSFANYLKRERSGA